MMDRASLRAVEAKPGLPPVLRTLPAGRLRAPRRGARGGPGRPRARGRRRRRRASTASRSSSRVAFTAVKAEYESLWDVRRGLFPAVGAARDVGTTVVIEDVAFPMEHLAAGTVELQRLFAAHGYAEGIIFGHALDGNLHFVFTQGFSDAAEVERYARFMDEVCEMVAVRFGGSLKGEHGTGRNMAPFVELEWGAKATGIMRRVKALLDPEGLLNPGVVLNDDPKVHLANLKALPRAHDLVDRCTECGFCEPRCPSRALTLTPRQRITVRREIARATAAGEGARASRASRRDYAYLGDDTCAADGMCATACPVGIDTGKLTKLRRAEGRSGVARAARRARRGPLRLDRGGRARRARRDARRAGPAGAARRAAAARARAVAGRRPRPRAEGRLLPRLRRADDGRGARRSRSPAGDGGHALGAREGRLRRPLPRRPRGALLRPLLRVEGLPAHRGREGEGARARAPRRDRGRPAPGRVRHEPLHAADEGDARSAPRRLRLRRVRPRPADRPAPVRAAPRARRAPRDLQRDEDGARAEAARARRRLRRAGRGAPHRLLRVRGGQGVLEPRAERVGAPRPARRRRRAARRGYSTSRGCEIGLTTHAGIPYQSLVHLVDACTTARDALPESSGAAA